MVQLLPHLAEVCKEARTDAGLGPAKIAGNAGYSASTSISRTFEGAEAWPQNPDKVIGAYAAATGVSVFDLWSEAVKRAKAEAAGPERAAQAVKQAGAATRRARAQKPDTQTPKANRRRAG